MAARLGHITHGKVSGCGDRRPRPRVLSKTSATKILAALTPLLFLTTLAVGIVGQGPVATISAIPTAFSNPIMVNDNKAMDQTLPVLVSVPGHGNFVAWQDARSGNEDIYASFTLNNGSSYSTNKKVDDSIVAVSKQLDPAAVVTENGTILVTWEDNRRSTYDFDVYFAKSYDGGITFTRNVKVDDSVPTNISWQEHPSIAVTHKGTIYVAWTDDRTRHLRIRGAYSSDGGNTWSASEEVAPWSGTAGQASIALAACGDRIFAAFVDNATGVPHPYYCVSNDQGHSFSNPVRLDGASGSVTQRAVTAAPILLPGPGVIVAWEDSRNGNMDIYATIASANGKIVASDIRVDDDLSGAFQEGVSISTDQLGNAYAAWEDERNGLFSIRFSLLRAGKTQFSTSIEVSAPGPNDMQRRPCLISPMPGQVYIVYQDDKFGTYDVYASGAFFPNLYDLALVRGWNFITISLSGYTYRASTLGLATGDVVVSWNNSRGAYDQTYIVGRSPPTSDFGLTSGMGYWVYASVAETLVLNGTLPTTKQSRNINVPNGGYWASLGFESINVSRHASDIPGMFSVQGGVMTVAWFDPGTQTYSNYFPGAANTDFPLVPGQAYWCWFRTSGTLTYYP